MAITYSFLYFCQFNLFGGLDSLSSIEVVILLRVLKAYLTIKGLLGVLRTIKQIRLPSLRLNRCNQLRLSQTMLALEGIESLNFLFIYKHRRIGKMRVITSRVKFLRKLVTV